MRQASVNKKLARLAAARAQATGASAEYLDLADYPMPIYDGDLEAQGGLPETARSLKARFRGSDGFLIASPEYNSSLPPVLKNALDWISRPETGDEPGLVAYRGKVAALMAASPSGMGGMRGLVPLRMMLGNIGVHVVPDQLTVPRAFNAFTASDQLADPDHDERLAAVVRTWVETARRLHCSG